MEQRGGNGELRRNVSRYVERAAAGERIVITDRGRPAALLAPLSAEPLAALESEGRLRRATRRIDQLPPPAEGAGSAVLEELRADRE